jgi:aryl-phospho-beta-D-glucosidase BglC (GH1 family)
MKKAVLVEAILIIGISILSVHAQQLNIFELNKKLGKGINMGNMFEAPSESAWGNPFRDDYFKQIAELGINHVRIPIRWDVPERTQQTAPYTINKTFLERIKYVVDKAIVEGLYVIINMHHHDELFQNPDGVKPRFISQWMQISEYFKSYDQKLLFEVLNEPNTNLVGAKWNLFFKDALTEIRKTNPTRGVLMGVAPWGGLSGVPNIEFPDDNYTILTIHYYDPFNFTHQGAEWVSNSNPWLGTKWENTQLERNEIISAFAFAQSLAKQKNKPIHVGEFGAYSKADLDSRIKWTNFLARWFESQGFSWAYWEWSAGFGIFNPTTNQVLNSLADALIKNPMLPAKQQNTVTVYQSNFNQNEGWSLQVQPNAGGTLTRSNGDANIEITKAGTEGWHIQLIKNNIKVKKGSRYQVTIKASSTVPLSITNYIGRNASPWDSYSGYKSISLTSEVQDHIYSFMMTSPTDTVARIAFDMGSKAASIRITSVKIEEVFEVSTPIHSEAISNSIMVYPNPAIGFIHINTNKAIFGIRIISISGSLLKSIKGNQIKTIDIHDLAPGEYFILVYTDSGTGLKKITKL